MNSATELMIKNIHPKWKVLLNTLTKTGESLMDILDRTVVTILETKGKSCPDHPDKVLRCLRLDPDLIKVIVCGQEPYPQPKVATGLAFACENDIQPSLRILLRELWTEYTDGVSDEFQSNLEQWESQGVLLLNSSLSCEQFKPGSHTKIWEEFMSGLFNILNEFKITRSEMTSLVFVFLGAQAKLYQTEVSEKLHYKIMRHHPVAEVHGSSKFEGFYKEVNKCLEESGQTKINWI